MSLRDLMLCPAHGIFDARRAWEGHCPVCAALAAVAADQACERAGMRVPRRVLR